ncbi:RluA family pseudouridine synthase [Nakamurella antarctica]|uniref:Pseudouridine synthase n=1 Tax=Nakamurella antarctica TaxID=1902245 RepID=A0A3G8ZKG2_9ACTN|nr:RluA family pseudouridine synthase [Nakamurella antarctica]AZI57802.1 RluA family pseudouridine synthase [Nakamurella antarctica]
MSELRSLPVPDGLAGERVDAGLARLLGMSRTAVAAIIDGGGVQIDGAVVPRSERLLPGSWLEITLPELERRPPVVVADVTGLGLLYEDEDIVVVDKPVGVAAHSSPGWDGPTVTGVLAARGVAVARVGAQERQGIVHRLDVGTTGAMVVAKSHRAYTALKTAFKERTVEKIYHAIAQGHPDPSSGTIDAPIGRHPKSDWKFAVVAEGRDSITHYDTLEMFPAATLVEVRLETGRTHQIRVHFSALHHVLVGDITYGADPKLAATVGLKRQWLHAHSLAFKHPGTGEHVQFSSPYPQDLNDALTILRNS